MSYYDLLLCPQTKQKLRLVQAPGLRKLNEKIRKGAFINEGGRVLKKLLDAALVREDGLLFYPIRDSIPLLLESEAIGLPPDAKNWI